MWRGGHASQDVAVWVGSCVGERKVCGVGEEVARAQAVGVAQKCGATKLKA